MSNAGRLSWRIATPHTVSAAIACIELTGDEHSLAACLDVLGVGVKPPGSLWLCNFAGIDEGVVARLSPVCIHLMPHGGLFVVRAIASVLEKHFPGCAGPPAGEEARLRAYPEARDVHEARMLDALASASSPRAVSLLLDQPGRWRKHDAGELEGPDAGITGQLNRLLRPPTVVALGASNIGKSTLVNALARRSVSIVADEPGTTRDHVGVNLDVDGLTIRFIDTPGVREDAPNVERRAWTLTQKILRHADLVLLCGDAWNAPLDLERVGVHTPHPSPSTLTLLLRADIGTAIGWSPEVETSAARGQGINELAVAIRRRLVTDEALADGRPWHFWPD
ncbi:MAG TPA: GTPase [Phycisphaerales bacterium]|nr:GTPase [Phycisphaerales bacterium]